MVRLLPIIIYKGKEFYVDARLKQIRAKENPYEFYNYDELDEDTMYKILEAGDPIILIP